jgi:hypothetical protein
LLKYMRLSLMGKSCNFANKLNHFHHEIVDNHNNCMFDSRIFS